MYRFRNGANGHLNQILAHGLRIARALQISCATAMLLLTICDKASATVDLLTIGGQPVVLTATEQSREEIWNWFAPTNPSKGTDYQHRYNFMGSWIRVGLGYQFDGVKAFAELMSPFFINLPDNAIVPPPPAKIGPQGLLGLGANYYQPHQNPNDASVFLKQAYLEFGRNMVPGLDIKGGRFEFFDGLEYLPSDLAPQLKWIATNRIAQRLIGNFGFSDVMRSFDGAVGNYGNGTTNRGRTARKPVRPLRARAIIIGAIMMKASAMIPRCIFSNKLPLIM